MPDQIALAVGIPAYGMKLDAGHAGMWMSFGHALASNEERFQLRLFGEVDTCPIADARNKLVQGALEADADWLLMVDADTFHQGQGQDDEGGLDILQMISDADKRGVAIAAAPVRMRNNADPHFMAWRKVDEVFQRVVISGPVGGIHNVDRVATALFAINLRWLCANMRVPPWFEHQPVLGSTKGKGEDMVFCDKVRNLGGEIMLDCRFQPKHIARRTILGE